jgi:hypothetical protein
MTQPSAQIVHSVAEHAIQMSGGGYHIRNQNPGVERVYPLAKWIEDNQQDGKVYRRRIIVVEDWHVVPPGDRVT